GSFDSPRRDSPPMTSLISTLVRRASAIGASGFGHDVGPIPVRQVVSHRQDVVARAVTLANLHLDGDRLVGADAERIAIQRRVDTARLRCCANRAHAGFAADARPLVLVQHHFASWLIGLVDRPRRLPDGDASVVFADHASPPRSPIHRYGSRMRFAPAGSCVAPEYCATTTSCRLR